jgi:hypothetical protein
MRVIMPEYERKSPPTAAEKLFKKTEQKIEGVKAFNQYRADESAKIRNMHRLREARVEREKLQ